MFIESFCNLRFCGHLNLLNRPQYCNFVDSFSERRKTQSHRKK